MGFKTDISILFIMMILIGSVFLTFRIGVNESSLQNDRCTFPMSIPCTNAKVDANSVSVRLANYIGDDIEISNLTFSGPSITGNCQAAKQTIARGRVQIVQANGCSIRSDQEAIVIKATARVSYPYKEKLPEQITGIIRAKVE